MDLVHFGFFIIFVLVLLYLALNNGTASVNILTAGSNFVSTETKTLQGR